MREHSFEGVIPYLERRYKETDSIVVRVELAKFRNTLPCPEAGALARDVVRKLRAGSVFVNSANLDPNIPFGGYKQSGNGREESIEELLACTQIKNINVVYRQNA